MMSGQAMVRKHWMKQLIIRFGKFDWDTMKDGEPPDYFNIEKLTKLVLCQIVYWDETHMKVKIGTSTEVKKQTMFPRDEEGNLDLVNGKYSDKRGNILRTKYPKEVRRCCGVAKILLGSNNKEVGVRCKSFDYSDKKILSINGFEVMIMK